jgi:NADH-quinone oxidoreductase subunit A
MVTDPSHEMFGGKRDMPLKYGTAKYRLDRPFRARYCNVNRRSAKNGSGSSEQPMGVVNDSTAYTGHATPAWALPVYGTLVIVVVLGMLLLSHFLGERKRERKKDKPYESGVESTGSAAIRFDVQHYLVAMIFIIFDLETVFIVAWAIAFRALGWAAYAGMVVFIGTLFAVLIYLGRVGALNWARRHVGDRSRSARSGIGMNKP